MSEAFLQGKTCLVTGGAEGIGWATAQALAAQGGDVYVCDISPENIEAAQKELALRPWASRIHFERCDVSERSQVEQWIREIHQTAGRVDVLINNAVYVRWENVTEMPVEEMERMMSVGYNGMVYTVKAALPLMLAAGSGHIINISSSAGKLFVSAGDAAYAAVKAAIDGFTQTLAIELEQTPVAVTVVKLAVVGGTDFFKKNVASARMPRMGDYIPSLTPPQVANGILRALKTRQRALDLPGYLPVMFLIFAMTPGLFRWLMKLGGSGRKDYGAVQWQYQSKAE